MEKFDKYLVKDDLTIRQVLVRLDELAADATVFVTDYAGILKGSITDGDIRRGLIRGIDPDENIMKVVNPHPKAIRKGENVLQRLVEFRTKNIQIVPVLEKDSDVICNVLNLRVHRMNGFVKPLNPLGAVGVNLRPV